MKKVFRSRIDWWLAVILIVAIMAPLVSAYISGSIEPLHILLSLFILSTFRTVYVVTDNKLRVWVGIIPFASKDISLVTSVRRTTSLISSPALSIDRLCVSFANGSSLIISPKDRDGFIAALQAVNGEIITDENAEERGDALSEETKQPEISAIRRWANICWSACVLILLAQVAYAYSVYDTMPERVATHFDLNGVPNGWMSRFWGIWGTVLESLGTLLFCWILTCIPGLNVGEHANEEEKRRTKDNLSLGVAVSALFTGLVFGFVLYYIVQKN